MSDGGAPAGTAAQQPGWPVRQTDDWQSDDWIKFLNEQEHQSLLNRQRMFLEEIDNENDTAVVKYLDDGLNPNFTGWGGLHDNKPRTPLMIAGQNYTDSYVMIRELLYHKADPNYSDDSGSVLHWVIYQNPFIVRGIPYASESLRLLLECGSNPFIRNDAGETAYDTCMDDPLGTSTCNALLLKEFMDIIRIQRCYRRKMTRKRVKTIKSKRRLALMKCMEFREGPLSTIRYDPSILERISKFI